MFQFGLMDIPDVNEITNMEDLYDDTSTDADLEAELAALTAGQYTRPKRKAQQAGDLDSNMRKKSCIKHWKKMYRLVF